ncbi:hypothetical protein K0U07_04670 [bacterium]|nr:hypothetical protein [bacterium]
MTNNYLPSTVFEKKEWDEEQKILVVGCNEALIRSLPKGTTAIDSSISKVQRAAPHHGEKTFLTQDLTAFDLGKKFTQIYSVGTMQCEKNLPAIFVHLEKHLEEEALLYFPLAPDPRVAAFLEEEKWIEHTKDAPFQKRSRLDVENAALTAPFDSVLIEEKIEHTQFYSKQALQTEIIHQLSSLTTMQGEIKTTCAKELTEHLYEGHDPDKVFTLSTPWILLTLSNDKELL